MSPGKFREFFQSDGNGINLIKIELSEACLVQRIQIKHKKDGQGLLRPLATGVRVRPTALLHKPLFPIQLISAGFICGCFEQKNSFQTIFHVSRLKSKIQTNSRPVWTRKDILYPIAPYPMEGGCVRSVKNLILLLCGFYGWTHLFLFIARVM